jgi:acetyl-CoA carboxylase biotin carboxyl carrier protein
LPITEEDIRALIRIFDASDWQDMTVELPDFKLVLSKKGRGVSPAEIQTSPAPIVAGPQSGAPQAQAHAATVASPPSVAEKPSLGGSRKVIKAPNLGTFWKRPKPDAPPYVEVGQSVDEETTVGVIEVMKLFTRVKAGVRGRVVQICVEDGQMVEYETPLFIVETN